MGMGLQGGRLVRAIQASRRGTLAETASEREHGSFARTLKNKNVDAVAIATPNDQHAKQVIAAARAGKHILCEKPLALSMREARAMALAVKKNNVRCFVNYHLRMHPEVLAARETLHKKKLGELTYIDMHWSIGGLADKKLPPLPRHMRWRESPAHAGGGALMARGVHLFDLLRFLTGEEVVEVRGWSDATKTQVDRTMSGIFVLASGTPASITTSKIIPGADNHITLYGSKGKLVLHDVFSDDPQPLYTKVFDTFTDALSNKKTPLATLDDGVATVALTEAFMRSVLA